MTSNMKSKRSITVHDVVNHITQAAANLSDNQNAEIALGTIPIFIAGNRENHIAIGSFKGIAESVVGIMDVHVHSESISLKGLLAIKSLCRFGEGSDTNFSESVTNLGSAGACGTVISIIKAHPDNIDIVKSAFMAIHHLSYDDTNAESLGTEGACHQIVTLLKKHDANVDVVLWGCKAMGNLCNVTLNRPKFAEAGGCEVIPSLLKKYPKSNDVIEYGCWSLSNLCVDNIDIIRKCLLADAFSIVSNIRKITTLSNTAKHEVNDAFEMLRYYTEIFKVLSSEKQYLQILFQDCNGAAWEETSNWDSERGVEEWFGIRVQEDGYVTQIQLNNNNLRGYLNDKIDIFSHLSSLSLACNKIKYQIPSTIGKLSTLTVLNLSNNLLSGHIPEGITALANLEHLDLSYNKLSGPVPETIWHLVNLKVAEFRFNRLTGFIPHGFCNCTQLESLSFDHNFFSGGYDVIRELKLNVPTVNISFDESLKIKFENSSYNLSSGLVTDKYEFGKQVGNGQYSVVKLGTQKYNKVLVAIKCIAKRDLPVKDVLSIKQEVLIQSRLRHPNIANLLDFYEDLDCFYMVLEYIHGGELFDRIIKRKRYSEDNARVLIQVLLQTMAYLHDQGIVHRDLKPENLFLTSHENDTDFKLADFGFADRDYGRNKLTEPLGTPDYVSPEILMHQSYGASADMWSVGVILYTLLVGSNPFRSRDCSPQEMYQRIITGQVHFGAESNALSPKAKDLVLKLLEVDPVKRFTAKQALNHNWIRDAEGNFRGYDHLCLDNIINEMPTFLSMSYLQECLIPLLSDSERLRLIDQLKCLKVFLGMGSVDDDEEVDRERIISAMKPYKSSHIMLAFESIRQIVLETAAVKAIKQKTRQWRRAKLVILGAERSGKTSVLRSLLSQPFSENTQPTVGIKITKVIAERVATIERKKKDSDKFQRGEALIWRKCDKKTENEFILRQLIAKSVPEVILAKTGGGVPAKAARPSAIANTSARIGGARKVRYGSIFVATQPSPSPSKHSSPSSSRKNSRVVGSSHDMQAAIMAANFAAATSGRRSLVGVSSTASKIPILPDTRASQDNSMLESVESEVDLFGESIQFPLDEITLNEADSLLFSIWECGGGHESNIFEMIQDLYLTADHIYLIVFDLEKMHKFLTSTIHIKNTVMWSVYESLSHLNLYAKNASVILVGTHADRLPSASAVVEISSAMDVFFKSTDLASIWLKIQRNQSENTSGKNLAYFPIDNTINNERNVTALRTLIHERVLAEESPENSIQIEYDSKWIMFYDKLMDTRSKSPYFVFNENSGMKMNSQDDRVIDIFKISSDLGLFHEIGGGDGNDDLTLRRKKFDIVDRICTKLHNLGLILYIRNPNENCVGVTDPQWLFDMVSSLLYTNHDDNQIYHTQLSTDEESNYLKFSQNGIISSTVLSDLWNFFYPHYPFLTSTMEQMRLLTQITNPSDQNPNPKEKYYYIPSVIATKTVAPQGTTGASFLDQSQHGGVPQSNFNSTCILHISFEKPFPTTLLSQILVSFAILNKSKYPRPIPPDVIQILKDQQPETSFRVSELPCVFSFMNIWHGMVIISDHVTILRSVTKDHKIIKVFVLPKDSPSESPSQSSHGPSSFAPAPASAPPSTMSPPPLMSPSNKERSNGNGSVNEERIIADIRNVLGDLNRKFYKDSLHFSTSLTYQTQMSSKLESPKAVNGIFNTTNMTFPKDTPMPYQANQSLSLQPIGSPSKAATATRISEPAAGTNHTPEAVNVSSPEKKRDGGPPELMLSPIPPQLPRPSIGTTRIGKAAEK